MKYNIHDLPPVDAYDDDEAQDAPHETPESPSFSADISSHWSIDDTSDWIERDLPKRLWIAPRYLMKRKLTALVGPPESGKSTLALKLGIALALDVPFGDFVPVPLPGEAPRPRRVAILNAEDDHGEQALRISSMIRETGRRVPDLARNLIRISPKETAKLFTAAPDTGEVCTTAAFDDLALFLKERAVDVLILDPLAEMMSSLDENSNGAMGGVFARLRKLAEDCDLTILVVHHTKKGVSVPGNLEAARGGSAMGGSIRIGLTLAVMSEPEAAELGIPADKRKYYVRLDNSKMSYGPPAESATWYQRHSIILDNGESSPALEPWTPPEAKALTESELMPIVADIKAGTGTAEPFSLKLSAEGRSIRHILDKHGIKGKLAQEQMLVTLRDRCAVVNAEYQRRNEKNQKRGTGWGARIGQFPAIEWISPG